MTAQKLSEGWQMVKFGDIAKLVSNRINPAAGDEDKYIGLEHLDSGSLVVERWGSDVPLKGQKLAVKEGDILFAKRNAYLKRVSIAPFDGIFSAHGMVIRPIGNLVDSEFLPIFMQSDQFMNRAIAISEGSLSPTIKWKTLALQNFVFPSIESQRKIISTQGKIKKSIDATNGVLESAIKLLEAQIFSTFKPKKDWVTYRLMELCEVKGGRQRNPENTTGLNSFKYLRPANIKRGEWRFNDVKKMDFSDDELKIYSLLPGDVLLVEGGEAEDVGDPAYWDENISGTVCFQNTLIRLRAYESKISTRNLFWLMCFLHKSGVFRAVAAGTKIKHIGTKNTAALTVKLPANISSLDSKIKSIEATRHSIYAISNELASAKALYHASLAAQLQE